MIRGLFLLGVGGTLGYYVKTLYDVPEVKTLLSDAKVVLKNVNQKSPIPDNPTEGE